MLGPIFLASIVIYITYNLFRRRNFPKGPFPLPILGGIYILRPGRNLFLQLYDACKSYGSDMISLKLFFRDGLVLNNCELITEAYVKNADAFSNRPNFSVFKFQGAGVALANGERWKTLRKHALTTMRELGVGKTSLEEKIQDEARYLIDSFKACKNAAGCDPKRHIVKAVSNIIAGIVYGERFDYNDPTFKQTVHEIETTFRSSGPTNPLAFFPDCFPLVSQTTFVPQLMKMNANIFGMIDRSVDEHTKSFDPNEIRDFIDIYLQSKNSQREEFTQDNLRHTIRDLFVAGTDTTANTLDWMILHMLNHPEIQTKMQKEIDEVLMGQEVTLKDRNAMVYTNAVIHETLRQTPPTVICPPRFTSKDVMIDGYTIVEGTTVFANIWAAHHDPKYWTNPHKFDPERWISKDGTQLLQHKSFFPFSIGHRSCLGELLARMELFIFTASLFQQFTFAPVDKNHVPKVEGTQGTTYMPNSYKIDIQLRGSGSTI